MESVNQVSAKQFFRKFPYVLIFNHLNLSAKEWTFLRIHLETFQKSSLERGSQPSPEILVIKNKKLLKCKSLKGPKSSQPLTFQPLGEFLLQGPCFLLGFSRISEGKPLALQVTKSPKIQLVGGIGEGQLWTHLDILKFFQVSPQIYPEFIKTLTPYYHLITLWNPSQGFYRSIPLQAFSQVYFNLFYCLKSIASQKSKIDSR